MFVPQMCKLLYILPTGLTLARFAAINTISCLGARAINYPLNTGVCLEKPPDTPTGAFQVFGKNQYVVCCPWTDIKSAKWLGEGHKQRGGMYCCQEEEGVDCDTVPFSNGDVTMDCGKVALKPGLEGEWSLQWISGDMPYCEKQ